MEELKKLLCQMQKLSYRLDDISSLVFVLREALWSNEDVLNTYYTLSSAYISNLLIDFEENFDDLMENMFRACRRLNQNCD